MKKRSGLSTLAFALAAGAALGLMGRPAFAEYSGSIYKGEFYSLELSGDGGAQFFFIGSSPEASVPAPAGLSVRDGARGTSSGHVPRDAVALRIDAKGASDACLEVTFQTQRTAVHRIFCDANGGVLVFDVQ